ncbi:regulator of Vps4 activity in the MVB pathway protein [Striga asiatica]|uniref:Regulator of Vps4 activity in the MVB pathway protein n=1 Tax=Striga asiatica TaxID=4170 RepID=A0A5A7R530_STRAF|nr:regulator of Vps4 activity in the MVB pathway protein [Striga asiatica]
MPPLSAGVLHRTVAAAFVLCLFAVAESSKNSQVGCSKTCVAENCNTIGIRYGKYCGVGWSGCPGEKPCDDLDSCCQIHDDCVEKKAIILSTLLLSLRKMDLELAMVSRRPQYSKMWMTGWARNKCFAAGIRTCKPHNSGKHFKFDNTAYMGNGPSQFTGVQFVQLMDKELTYDLGPKRLILLELGEHSMIDIKCHEKFKRCIKKVLKSGKKGFSKTCPYDTAVPTMVQAMKKSKLLQNSKDLLSRSFNPAKCKTSLRLASSRFKLLRNKKEVQVKQMRREIAQLLESGQDQTAQIRVEHVIREEKMMAAYDLLEIYCELIIARLPIIESQKNCPIDLKEAIASLVFAAPRCGDVPELLDVRKQFTAKYGKDFTTAAIELRPQCGVGRMLVEKLSATAPDGQTKTKILTTIAEEHNVKWEPKSFGEKDPGPLDDRLSGPSSFGKLVEQHPEPPTQVQVRPTNNTLPHSSPSNFGQRDDRTSEKPSFAQSSGSTSFNQSEARPPGDERSREDSNMYPLDGRRWNMEFKDAKSAAQAAAESAERASMAARAAAELSSHSRIVRQYSTELDNSDVDTSKYEEHPQSNFSYSSNDRSSAEHATRLQNVQQTDGVKVNDLKTATTFKEDGAGSSQEHIQSFSSNPKGSGGEYSQKNSLKGVSNDDTKIEKPSFSYEAETANNWPERAENFEEKRTGKRHSTKSSHSRSSISEEDVNIFSNSDYKKFENNSGESPPFVGREAPKASTHESAALFFDKYDSDTDDGRFDLGPTYDEPEELDFHLPSRGRKLSDSLPAIADSWGPSADSSSKIVTSTSSLFFSGEKLSPDISESTELRNDPGFDSTHVTFDESDGPISNSDDDTKNTRHRTVYDYADMHKQNEGGHSVKSSFKHRDGSVFRSKDLSLSSDDELSPSMEIRRKNRGQDSVSDEDSPLKLGFIKPEANQSASVPKQSWTESKEIDDESNSERVERLNFGKLTGGFRHKGHRNQLSFIKNRRNVPSSDRKESQNISSSTEEPEIGTTLDENKISTQVFHSDPDSDTSDEELSQTSSHDKKDVKEVKTKPNLFFGSDNSDSDDYVPKESLTGKSNVRSGISRRTKASPSTPKTDSYTKEALDSDVRISRKPQSSFKSETSRKSESPRKNSSKWETYEQPKPTSTKSNFQGPPEHPRRAKASSVTKQELEARDIDSSHRRKPENSFSPEIRQDFESQKKSSLSGNSDQTTSVKLASKPTNSSFLGTSTSKQQSKVSQKSSIVEEPSGYKPKEQAPISSENTSSGKVDSPKKASHVHPKLPDYDTLFQSLRINRS